MEVGQAVKPLLVCLRLFRLFLGNVIVVISLKLLLKWLGYLGQSATVPKTTLTVSALVSVSGKK